MFSRIMNEFQCPEHQEKMHFLLDLESAMKEGLAETDAAPKNLN